MYVRRLQNSLKATATSSMLVKGFFGATGQFASAQQ